MKKPNHTLSSFSTVDEDAILDFEVIDEIRGGNYSMTFDESAESAIFDKDGLDTKQLNSWLKTVRFLLEED